MTPPSIPIACDPYAVTQHERAKALELGLNVIRRWPTKIEELTDGYLFHFVHEPRKLRASAAGRPASVASSSRANDAQGQQRVCLYHAPGDNSPDATIERVVRQLTREIQQRTGLPASVGIATSRSVAKVASGLAKPQ